MEHTRADDRADDAPHRHRERVVFRVAGADSPSHGQPDADESPDSSKEAVPGDLERHALPPEQGGIDVDRDSAWNDALPSSGDNNSRGPFRLDWPTPTRHADRWQSAPRVACLQVGENFDMCLVVSREYLRASFTDPASTPEAQQLYGSDPMPEQTEAWESARELASMVCDTARLPLDELTEKMFSRVGQYTPRPGT